MIAKYQQHLSLCGSGVKKVKLQLLRILWLLSLSEREKYEKYARKKSKSEIFPLHADTDFN